MGEAIVRVRSVTKRWGSVTALSEVTLDIEPGVTGLLGANGAGKTTLLGLLLGFQPPDEGTIEVLGRDPVTAGPEVRAGVGYAPEHDPMPPDVRAQDLVRHIAELHGIPRDVSLTRASDTLHLLGLGEERMRQVGTLSTGQKQRVKMAQAIAHDPELVLLDEPTEGLDPLQRDEMLRTIRRIGRELGIHVVVSSHLLGEVERICDNVVVLDQGTLAGAGALSGFTGETRSYDVEVDGPAAELVAGLARSGLVVQATGPTRFRLDLADDAAVARLLDEIDASGLGLRRLQPLGRRLEDVFFSGAPS